MERRPRNHPHDFLEIWLKALLTSTRIEPDRETTAVASKLSRDPDPETVKPAYEVPKDVPWYSDRK